MTQNSFIHHFPRQPS